MNKKEEMWKKILGMGKCDFCDKPATYETQKGEYEDYSEDFARALKSVSSGRASYWRGRSSL